MAKVCFLLGVMPRSGTNYISNVLTLHSRCSDSDPIYEDFLLSQSHLLRSYTKKVNRYWNPQWDKSNQVLSQDKLLKHIGQGLISFLQSSQDVTQLSDEHTVIAKTPSTKNIENFFTLFPDAKLLVVMRDGRAVVESGMKSFDWDFEKATYDWNVSTKRIMDFISNNHQHEKKLMVMKYEDMLVNTQATLKKVLNFLDVPDNEINEQDVKSLFVSGSSEVRGKHGDMTWSHMENSINFKPLERFSQWEKDKLRRFEWLAGESLFHMGYIETKPHFNTAEKIKHYLLDISWFCRIFPKTIKFLVKEKKLILKTY